MKILKNLAILGFFALLSSSFLKILVHAQDQSDFISIDCGIAQGSSYTDVTTGIKYVSDSNFTDSGESKSISPEYRSYSRIQQCFDVRSFPDGTRNCYTLKPARGKNDKYLIRATFMYGNYDGKGVVPEFDLYLGVNLWDTMKFDKASSIIFKEIIHTPSTDYVHVCLVNTGSGIPFISALELRLLKNNTYNAPASKVLAIYTRLDLGSTFNGTIRYKDDVYDRIWLSYSSVAWTQLSTSLAINNQDYDYQPPNTVMVTAATPIDSNASLDFSWQAADSSAEYYVYLYFSELQVLDANEFREFDIYLNDVPWYPSEVPPYLGAGMVYSSGPINKGGKDIRFSLKATEISTLPPILNAVEIYTVKDMSKLQTDQQDVNAIMDIKSIYGVKKNWQGDPCVPTNFSWNGIECNKDDINPPKIITLNLSSSGLTGNIASAISNLISLKTLDLSNNTLTGPVPEFLSQHQSLATLNLKGNNLTGLVPEKLTQKANSGFLTLSVDDQNTCTSTSCNKPPEKKSKGGLIAISAVISTIVLSIIGAIVAYTVKRVLERVRNARQIN